LVKRPAKPSPQADKAHILQRGTKAAEIKRKKEETGEASPTPDLPR